MTLRLFALPFALLLLLGTAIAACGGDDDDGDDAGPDVTEPAGGNGDDGDNGDDIDDGDNGDNEDDGGNGGGNGGGGFGSGSGTLTIGDMTWEITGVGCVFSAEEAGNPDFPFNLAGFAESEDGARLQLSADIYDPSGEERLEGDGVSHNISLYDVSNLMDPTVDWSDVGGLFGGEETVITINGKNISGEGVFDDGNTDEFESVPGTMEITCP